MNVWCSLCSSGEAATHTGDLLAAGRVGGCSHASDSPHASCMAEGWLGQSAEATVAAQRLLQDIVEVHNSDEAMYFAAMLPLPELDEVLLPSAPGTAGFTNSIGVLLLIIQPSGCCCPR